MGGQGLQGGRDDARRVAAASLAVAVALAAGSATANAGPARRTTLTPAEQAFKKAYVALVPSLNRASGAIVKAVENAGKDTDAQVVTVFTNLAHQWSTATRPLLALRAPAPDAALFAAVTQRVPAVDADLLATAQAGRARSGPAGKKAGHQLAVDFNALGAAVGALKKKLGLP